jgi:TonB family protein
MKGKQFRRSIATCDRSGSRYTLQVWLALILVLVGNKSWSANQEFSLPNLKNPNTLRPEYPPSLRRAEIQGSARVALTIGPDGRVTSTELMSSTNAKIGASSQEETRRAVFAVPMDWESSGGTNRHFEINFVFTLGECEHSNRFDAASARVYVCAMPIVPLKPGPDCSSLEAIHSLQLAKPLWDKASLKTYSYVVRYGAFYSFADWPESGTVKVVVRNGKVESPSASFVSQFNKYLTVAGIYEHIADVAATSPDCLKVQFDSTNGVPLSVYSRSDVNVSDNEETVTIEEFRIGR